MKINKLNLKDEYNLYKMSLSLKEIADMILKDIYQTIGEDDTLEMDIIYGREEYSKFGNNFIE